jgi:hypothetical protein
MNTTENTASPGFGRMGQTGTGLAVIGLIGLCIGLFIMQGDPDRLKHVLQSYLYGWVLAMLLALGCYGFMLLHYMSRGSWGKPTIRLFEAGAKCLPIMGLLFIPILIWVKVLYPWADTVRVFGDPAMGIPADELLKHKASYLNQTMFIIRTIVYFGIWFGFTSILTRYSAKQDETGDIRYAVFRQKASAYGFLIYVVTTTLAFTDWIMSLDAHWFSTIYGFWFVDFQGLATIAFISLIVCRNKMAHKEPYDTLVDPQLTRDLGNLMLTLTMIWAYFSLSQWLIIWSGNLPEEITFYLRRNSGTFLLVGAANIIFSFFVPFVLLLSGNTKRSPTTLASVAILVLIMRLVDIFWVVIPVTRHPISLIPTDIAGALFSIGAFLATFGYFVKQAPLVPLHEEQFGQEAVAHG